MSFNYEQVFKDMLSAGKGALQAGGKEAEAYFEQVMTQQKSVLQDLAKAAAEKSISIEDLKDEIGALKGDVVAELEGMAVIAEEAAQNAWNAAVVVLITAVKAII